MDLPDPDGPTIAASSPAATARLTWSSARTGGCPGYTFDTRSSSSTGSPSGRPGGRAVLRAGHDAATTTRCPGVSAPVTCTRPAASSKIPAVTGTQRRVFPGPATSTAYPPGDWATSAVTGTASTGPGLLAVVMFTVTGAWSRVPAALGSVSVTCTGIVVAGALP